VVSARRIAIALALFGAAACTRVPDQGAPSASSTAADIGAAGSQIALIERIEQAPLHVRHGGTRRVEFWYETEGTEHALAYQEHVTADGRGRFALDPGKVETPALSTSQREIFELVQKQREGFFFRYRDFGVRQRALFEANYSVQVVGAPLTVAGRECTQIEVRRIGMQARSTYRAAVDVGTGLVLRWTETSAEGRLLARSEFLDFTLDPALDGVDWFESPLEVEALQPGLEDASVLGFRPHQLQVLPAGYQLLRSERIVESGATWLRRVYGDGLENLFVLERGADVVPLPGGTPAASTDGASRASLTNAAGQIVVRLCQVGAWTLAEVASGQGQLFVVGKVGESDVVDCLRSAY
jgi:hypothetical protein